MDEDLLSFIRAAIPSVWALEILLLMRRDRDRAWTRDSIARELRSNPNLAGEVLRSFVNAGLLASGPEGSRYAPAGAALDELVGRLDQTYRERPVAVVNAIVSARAGAVQSFADAFRVRRDKGQ